MPTNMKSTKYMSRKKKYIRRKKKTGKQPKGWKFPPPDPEEEEEVDVEEPILNENNQTDKESEVHKITPQGPMELHLAKMSNKMKTIRTK